MNNLLSIVSAVLALVGFIFFGLFKKEKSKRIKAEEKTAEKEKDLETKIVEAETLIVSQEVESQTLDKLNQIQKDIEQKIEETKVTPPKNQRQLYNEKVKGWKKVER